MSAEVASVGAAATRRFLWVLYRSAPPGSFVEVRFRVASGMGRSFHPVARLERVVRAVGALASRTDVYVGVVPRARHGGRREDLVARASVVWVDCDSRESATALEAFRPQPAIVVASSGENRHAYWLLEDAVDLDRVESVNRGLAVVFGADVRSSDAARILRPAGSMNRKHSPPVAVRLLRAEERRVGLVELEHMIPVEFLLLPRRARRVLRGAPADPLLSLAPALYVERLTGQRVGRSGKVRCPFHEDRTPSLHVYHQPAQGWACFGCGRGGSVYDFAGELWQLDTRGPEFLALRNRLHDLLLSETTTQRHKGTLPGRG